MPVDFTWQSALEDWANAARPLALIVIENGVFNRDDPWCVEYRELNDKLQRATLQEIDALPVNSFGAIGDIVCVLKPEAAAWLMPVLLRFGSVSSESIYARSVIDALRQRISKMTIWSEIKRKISPVTRDRLYELARSCCDLGWDDEERVVRRMTECKEMFY